MKTVYALPGAVVFAVFLAGCIIAPGPYQARTAATFNPVPVEDILALSKAGIADDTIISQIKATRTVYRLTAAQIVELKNAGVSQKVIDCMINTALYQPSAGAATVEPASYGEYYYVEPGWSYDYHFPAPYPFIDFYVPPFPLFGPHNDFRPHGDPGPHRNPGPHGDNPPRGDNKPHEGHNQQQGHNQPQGHDKPPRK